MASVRGRAGFPDSEQGEQHQLRPDHDAHRDRPPDLQLADQRGRPQTDGEQLNSGRRQQPPSVGEKPQPDQGHEEGRRKDGYSIPDLPDMKVIDHGRAQHSNNEGDRRYPLRKPTESQQQADGEKAQQAHRVLTKAVGGLVHLNR